MNMNMNYLKILSLSLLLGASSVQAGWIPETQCYVFDGEHGPTNPPSVGFPSTLRVPAPGMARSFSMNNLQWNEISLDYLGVPPDAVSVTLQGLMIITHGTTPEICNMQVFVQRPGAKFWASEGQVVEASVGNGIRSGWTATTAVENGSVWVAYIQNGGETGWPSTCAFTTAMWVGKWCR